MACGHSSGTMTGLLRPRIGRSAVQISLHPNCEHWGNDLHFNDWDVLQALTLHTESGRAQITCHWHGFLAPAI